MLRRGSVKVLGSTAILLPKYIGKIVSYQGLVFFLPAVVLKIPDLGTKSTTTGILVMNKFYHYGVCPL